jgi:hypothetical protein
MHVRRILTAVAATTLAVGGLGLAVAPSASAATVDVVTDCNSDAVIYANVGDTVVFHLTAACLSGEGFVWNGNGLWVRPGVPMSTTSGYFGAATFASADSEWNQWLYSDDWGAYSDGSGDTTITTTLRGVDGDGTPIAPGSVLAVTGPDGYSNHYFRWRDADAPPPPSWYQAVGRGSADASCDAGWTASWAQWPNDGTGGWVCQREQYYDTATGAWAYRSARK